MRLFKQLVGVFTVVGVLIGILLMFTYDVIKIDWPSFMEIQPSYRPMEDPLPVPEHSIPVEGAAYIPNMGAPENPSTVDEASLTRGAELYAIHCQMCNPRAMVHSSSPFQMAWMDVCPLSMRISPSLKDGMW
jgi:hypothetical protein